MTRPRDDTGAALLETVGLMAAVAVLIAGLVATGGCQPARRAPVRAVDEIRALVRPPAPPRVRATGPRRRPAPSRPRPRPPATPVPTWLR